MPTLNNLPLKKCNLTMFLLRSLLFICLIVSTSVYSENLQNEWVSPTSATVQALKKAFDIFEPSENNNELLSDYLITLSILRGPMQKCVDDNKQELKKYNITSETLESGDSTQSTITDQSLKDIEQRQNRLKNDLVSCTAILLEIKSLSDNIKQKQSSILSEYLLAKDPNILQSISDNFSHLDSWLDTIKSFLKSRLQLQTLLIKDWALLLLMIVVGGFIGKVLGNVLNTFAHSLTAKELTTQLSLSLCHKFASVAPYLFATAGALAALLLIMQISQWPPSIALLIALISYLLISTIASAILKPEQPAEMIVHLSANSARRLYNRLHFLLLLGLLVLLAFVIDLREAMTEDQWRITHSVTLLLASLNLVWLITYLNRVPGILGTTFIRSLAIIILLSSLIAEVIGYRNLSLYLFKGLLGSVMLAVALWLANALLTDIFDGLDEGRHRWQQYLRKKLRLKKNENVPGLLWLRLTTILGAWTVFVISVVKLWGYNVVNWTMLAQLLTDGFNLGEYRIVPMKLVMAVVIFSLLITFIRWFKQDTLPGWVNRTSLDRGAREALISISGYIGIIIAAVLGLSIAGFSFTNIAIVAGALSLGIGFGLQNIVNNFISGIILLFERPIRTGDWIVVGNTEGYVRKISIRSTQIETFDRADVIVPNSELISNQVTNWMLHDPWGRVIIPVGVAYGSDVEKVRDVLLKVASEHDLILSDEKKVSPPKVLFRGFGDSSLNFELRCYIRNIDRRLDTSSDLNFAIDKAFREAGIEIPFPQRDIHIRSESKGQSE